MGFISPVEGEVLLQKTPKLKWNAVPGATAYVINVSGVGDDYTWSTQSTTVSARIPKDHALPQNLELRAVIQTVPEDLVPLGSISVTFSRENAGRFLSYRMISASLTAKILGLMGLLSIGLGIFKSKSGNSSLDHS